MLLNSLAPVSTLLLSVSILLMGSGLQGTLIPIRANMEAFSSTELGVLGTAYFLGFTIGCINGPALVRRSGHIRAYLAMTSLASVITLLHAMFVAPLTWWVLRAVAGYCFAVLYIVIESWLNSRADNQTRGTIFSIYIAINLSVITLGQLMLGIADPASFKLFAIASILVSLAALPVAFTMAATPPPAEFVRPRLKKLYKVSPVGFTSCFAVGLANGAFWAFAPVFAQNRGLTVAGVSYFMSAVVLGGALLQWPLGSLSDRTDRRRIIVFASIIAIAAAIGITFVPADDTTMFIVAGAIFGAGAFPLYAIAVAHANDNADISDYVEVSSGLLLVYGVGAATGPLLAALSRGLLSSVPTLFLFTAAVHLALAAYVGWRISQREPPPEEDRVNFSDAAIAAQTVLPIDATEMGETAEPAKVS